MNPAISVKNLGKRYKLGLVHTDLLSEKIGSGLRAIGKRLRKGSDASYIAVHMKEDETFWALKDISFEVQPGEVVGVIGRNGAGKSTLLKMLSRITSPTVGEVQLQGRVASLLEVGTGFHPELTGRENIFLNGAILGMTRNEIIRKFEEIVLFAGVQKFIDTPVKRYSSGMYVRLAFAVAAHLDPEILLVDEVLAVGDAAFQKKCLKKMEDVAGRGRTILFVSHNMVSIKRLCDRTILLEDGNLVEFGDTNKVIERYYQNGLDQRTSATFSAADHRTESEFKISGISIVNHQREPVSVIRAGEQIGLKIHLNSDIDLGNVYLGLEIHFEGVNLATFWKEGISMSKGQETVLVCMFEKSILKPGVYDLHMGATDVDSGRPLDWIPDAMSFQVVESEFRGGSGSHERDIGIVKIPHVWHVEEKTTLT